MCGLVALSCEFYSFLTRAERVVAFWAMCLSNYFNCLWLNDRFDPNRNGTFYVFAARCTIPVDYLLFHLFPPAQRKTRMHFFFQPLLPHPYRVPPSFRFGVVGLAYADVLELSVIGKLLFQPVNVRLRLIPEF